MTSKELEHKITKALHKANRARPLKLKLEKVNEVLEEIHALLNGISAGTQDTESQEARTAKRLAQYIELCRIHKLKFQFDALLRGVLQERQTLAKHPEQMTQARFDSFVRRLNVVLDTDPEHPEALALLEELNGSYRQYAEGSCVRNVYIALSQHQTADVSIAFVCPLALITQHEKLAGEYGTYQQEASSESKNVKESVRLQFSLTQLDAFAEFHEELHTSAQYQIFVNGTRIKEASFSEWFHCYQSRLKADTPQYCYGASPFTLNVFGCHKLSQPDIAGRLDRCWFHRGERDRESGLFLIDSEETARQIRQRLDSCGFCPFLNEEKLHLGMGLLPQYINPECDEYWDEFYEDNRPVGVIPAGSEIAIAHRSLESDKIDSSNLIETDSSPYARRMLEYVNAQDKRVLCETRYKGITRCMNCGAHYKAHTMECPKCKGDFVRDALENPDKILRELSYVQPVKYPGPSAPSTAPTPENGTTASSESRKPVSFDQLWNDPQIRKILSDEPENDSTPDIDETSDETTEAPASVTKESPRLQAQERDKTDTPPDRPDAPLYDPPEGSPNHAPVSSGRFDLHGKLRSLVSKKYRERKAIEDAFSTSEEFTLSPPPAPEPESRMSSKELFDIRKTPAESGSTDERLAELAPTDVDLPLNEAQDVDEELLHAIQRLKPRQRSELSKRGVVRVIYHATMDLEECPLCAHLDGMVMDPDDSSTDIFSPPLFPGCTCSREYVLKTEKPSNWPEVNFQFPPKELLSYIQKD